MGVPETYYDEDTLLLSIELPVAIVFFLSWLFLIVYSHFLRKYGQSGFKVEMCSRYCSMKEVFSCLYILSHWVCFGIVTYLVIIDYKIDGKILPTYEDADLHHLYDYVFPSLMTHDSMFATWLFIALAIYFIAGISNTLLAIELFGDRGRVPYQDGAFARPDYIG